MHNKNSFFAKILEQIKQPFKSFRFYIRLGHAKKSSGIIWIHVNSPGCATIMAILAHQLIEQNERVFFIIEGNIEIIYKKIAQYIPNFEQIQVSLNEINENLLNKNQLQIITKWPDTIREKFPAYVPQYLATIFKDHFLKHNLVDELLNKHKPDILLIPEDGLGGNHCLIKACQDRGIRVIIVPYGFGSERDYEDSLAQKYKNDTAVDVNLPDAQIVRECYPHWIKQGRFDGALFLTPEIIMVREALGYTVKNPWTVHGGNADFLSVESKRMYEHYIRERIPVDKLVPVGSIYSDILRNTFDEQADYWLAYNQAAKIFPDKTRILISWLPSYHNERGYLCEFDDYETVTKNIFDFLLNIPHVEITVSTHPAVTVKLKDYFDCEKLYISQEYIVSEIPRHDIFVCCNSSTLRWATAAGKPVVNYNFYQFSTEDYNDIPGLRTVTTFEQFKTIITTLCLDEQFYHQTALLQKQVSKNWGNLFENNFNKLYDLIKKQSVAAKSKKEKRNVAVEL